MSENIVHFPFNHELEADLLAAFMINRKMWITFYEHINPSYFENANIEKIFKIIKAYFERYKNFPTENQFEVLMNKITVDPSVLKTAKRVYTKMENIQHHEMEYLFTETEKFIKEQKIKHAILTGVDLLDSGKYVDIEEHIKKAVAWNPNIHLGIQLINAEERYIEADAMYDNALTTPWKRLNSVLGGGLFEKTLTAFVASSSVGKSIALDQCAYHFWDKLKKNVVMITLEVSELRKSLRMDAYGTQSEISTIRGKKDEIIKFYDQKKDYKNKLFIKEFPTSSVSTKHIENYLYQLELYAGLHISEIGAILIDYGDILLPNNKKTGKTYDDQGNSFENMRSMAQSIGPPVLSAAQLNRGAIDMPVEEVSEHNLADSLKKMFICDNIVALISRAEDRAIGRMYAKTIKARDGIKDQIIGLQVDYPRLTIRDLSDKKPTQ